MKHINISFAVVASIVLAALTCAAQEQTAASEPTDPVSANIEKLIGRKRSDELKRFYEERNFAPAWSKSEQTNNDAKELIKAIGASEEHGLNPNLYHKNAIDQLKISMDSAGDEQKRRFLAEQDILMTDAFFTLSSHLDSGLTNPYFSNANQRKPESNTDLVAVLNMALQAHDVADALNRLAPQTEEYKRLKEALPKMQEIAARGSWPTVPPGEKIEPGNTNQRIIAVRRRFEATGFLKPPVQTAAKTKAQINEEMMATQDEPGEDYYDEKLKEAMIRFQEKFGLMPDGVIGKRTVQMLSTQPDWHVCQIKINLDRMRALDELLSKDRYALVNLPDFTLKIVDDSQEVMKMKVIVGRVDRKSPLMSDMIRFIVFSPKWHVPTSIAVKDKLPKIKEDPSFIRRQGMKVYTTGPTGIEEIDPENVDWESVDAQNFTYRIVQASGDANALGRVKFMFPNRHDVYLHDTPTKYLFNRCQRTYSSGCIRIADPIGFAKFLLKDKEEWDSERIDSSMKRATPLFVNLDEHLPIYILYLTAWADEEGNPVFRQDVYGFDQKLSKQFCTP
ncbi:MAG: L,D-transpeptidase family protein [Pseudomonadota bacterium]